MGISRGKVTVLIGGLAALLLFSAGVNLYYWSTINELTQKREEIEQQAHALLSTQNQMIDRLKEQAHKAQENNESLYEKVQELNALLSQVNAEIWELRTGRTPQGKNMDLIASTNTLKLAGADLLSKENTSLRRQNDRLTQELALLQDSLQALVENSLTADGFRMVAYKRNNKETAKAKKVDRLTVSLHIPPEFNLPTKEVLYLSLTDMHGKGITDPLQSLTISTEEREMVVPVHDLRVVDFREDKNGQQVTFYVYRSANVQPGRYRASVYTKNRYLGSVELQFRDSFWFF
jgi:hypothetical protein